MSNINETYLDILYKSIKTQIIKETNKFSKNIEGTPKIRDYFYPLITKVIKYIDKDLDYLSFIEEIKEYDLFKYDMRY